MDITFRCGLQKTLPYYAIRLAVDGTDYTEVASIAAVDAAGKWFYDSATKILYARVTGDVDPSTLFSVVEYRLFLVMPRCRRPTILPGAVQQLNMRLF